MAAPLDPSTPPYLRPRGRRNNARRLEQRNYVVIFKSKLGAKIHGFEVRSNLWL